MEEQEKKERDANSKFQSTEEAFRKYAEAHPEDDNNLEEPNFHYYYSPSKDQKMEKVYTLFYQLED